MNPQRHPKPVQSRLNVALRGISEVQPNGPSEPWVSEADKTILKAEPGRTVTLVEGGKLKGLPEAWVQYEKPVISKDLIMASLNPT